MTRAVLAREARPEDLAIRVEPWVNRAAAFAIANGFVSQGGGKSLALTESGKAAAGAIRKEGVLVDEVAFLEQVGKLATEQVIEHIMRMEDF